jgi:hypothetical protein
MFCPGTLLSALSYRALVKGLFELRLLTQHPELNWTRAITQFLGAFQPVHPSGISVAMLLPWTLGQHAAHLQR